MQPKMSIYNFGPAIGCSCLQNIRRQLGKFGSLAFLQLNVGRDSQIPETTDYLIKAVG